MTPATQTRKDFLSVLDFDAADLEHCLQLAAQLKADRSLGRHAPTEITCAPGFTQPLSITGAGDDVTRAMTSAPMTASPA